MRNNNNQPQNQNTASNEQTTSNSNDYNGPDYIAVQYRMVKVEDGWKTRKERIGAAFKKSNGSICFRPTGQQLIDNDIYLFPNNDNGPTQH